MVLYDSTVPLTFAFSKCKKSRFFSGQRVNLRQNNLINN
jgi:hypothetical protein